MSSSPKTASSRSMARTFHILRIMPLSTVVIYNRITWNEQSYFHQKKNSHTDNNASVTKPFSDFLEAPGNEVLLLWNWCYDLVTNNKCNDLITVDINLITSKNNLWHHYEGAVKTAIKIMIPQKFFLCKIAPSLCISVYTRQKNARAYHCKTTVEWAHWIIVTVHAPAISKCSEYDQM